MHWQYPAVYRTQHIIGQYIHLPPDYLWPFYSRCLGLPERVSQEAAQLIAADMFVSLRLIEVFW